MMIFYYDQAITRRFPSVVGGVIYGQGLYNAPASQELSETYLAEQRAVAERLAGTPLNQLPALAAWRSAFRQFGVEPTQYRCAAESLLRRLTKKGDIPGINTLVDIGNLVSIRYALPSAVFDTRAIHGALHVHFADGTERYTKLGEEEQEQEIDHPDVGEVVFSDESGLVMARRWCWRQSEQSAAQPDTTAVIITIEAHHANARGDIEAALQDLLDLLRAHAGGTYQSAILDATHPAFAIESPSSLQAR